MIIMEKYIIDRFEGEIAVLEKEDGGCIDVSRDVVNGAKEGDVLLFENGIYKILPEETALRKKRIEEKMKKLFKK